MVDQTLVGRVSLMLELKFELRGIEVWGWCGECWGEGLRGWRVALNVCRIRRCRRLQLPSCQVINLSITSETR